MEASGGEVPPRVLYVKSALREAVSTIALSASRQLLQRQIAHSGRVRLGCTRSLRDGYLADRDAQWNSPAIFSGCGLWRCGARNELEVF